MIPNKNDVDMFLNDILLTLIIVIFFQPQLLHSFEEKKIFVSDIKYVEWMSLSLQ